MIRILGEESWYGILELKGNETLCETSIKLLGWPRLISFFLRLKLRRLGTTILTITGENGALLERFFEPRYIIIVSLQKIQEIIEIQNKTNCAENVQLLTQRLNQKRYRVASLSISQRSCSKFRFSETRCRQNGSANGFDASRAAKFVGFSPTRVAVSNHPIFPAVVAIRPRIGARKKRNSRGGRIDGIDGRFYYRSFDRWRLTGRENNSACLHSGYSGHAWTTVQRRVIETVPLPRNSLLLPNICL